MRISSSELTTDRNILMKFCCLINTINFQRTLLAITMMMMATTVIMTMTIVSIAPATTTELN